MCIRDSDKYEASARVFVDSQSILRPLMSGLVTQPNVDQQVMMLSLSLIHIWATIGGGDGAAASTTGFSSVVLQPAASATAARQRLK